MKKIITWQLNSGKQASVSVELITKKTINADGHKVDVDTCEIEIIANIDGIGCIGFGEPQNHPKLPAGYVSHIGKLVIDQKNTEKIYDAIYDIKGSEIYQEHLAKIEENKKSVAQYEKANAEIKKAMGGSY